MAVHQIDVVNVQSFCYHGKVATELSYVHGVYLIEDVVRVGLHCIITVSPAPLTDPVSERVQVPLTCILSETVKEFSNYNEFSVCLNVSSHDRQM